MYMYKCIHGCSPPMFITARSGSHQIHLLPDTLPGTKVYYKLARKGERTSFLCVPHSVACIPTWERFCETTLWRCSVTLVPPGRVYITASMTFRISAPSHPIIWVKPRRSVCSLPRGWFCPGRPRTKKLQVSKVSQYMQPCLNPGGRA